MSAAVQATTFGPGNNLAGVNQHSKHIKDAKRRERIQRRFEAVVAEQIKADPLCVETIVQNLVAAMKDPDLKPHAARHAFERIWPAFKQPLAIDLRAALAVGTVGDLPGPADVGSAERRRFAAIFGAELAEEATADESCVIELNPAEAPE